MNSKEKITKIFRRSGEGLAGFWTGNPHNDTTALYLKQLKLKEKDEIFTYLNDDCRFLHADRSYKHPEGKPIFDYYLGKPKQSHSQAGCFAECENVAEVERYDWPNPDYLDFDEIIARIRGYKDEYILSGMWCPFFHNVGYFFGMENYFVKMYTDPKVVEAVTERVVDFYLAANERFFQQAGDSVDAFFFGNDFGTQIDLLISPELFVKFVLPGFKKLIAGGKKYGKQIVLHSCGSIYKVIPYLIEAGIDVLHPLQARAANMDAVTLAREFKQDIAFLGGVDTQDLLVNASPQQIKDEVRRLRDVLGPNYVVSPSHETLLPNVPLENVVAMAEAALE